MPRTTTLVMLAALLAAAPAAHAQPFIAEDFDPTPLPGAFIVAGSNFGYSDPDAASSIVAQGNPGNAAQLDANMRNGQSIALLEVTFGGASSWDTATQGPVTLLGFSMELWGEPVSERTFAPTVAYAFRLHDLDNPGVFYTTPTMTTIAGQFWNALEEASLLAEDFRPIAGGDDHPDLSTGRWGFNVVAAVQRPAGAGDWGGRYRLDNIQIRVDTPLPPGGPRILLHAPTRAPDDVFYGREPISRIQVAFDRAVNFTASDITLTSATSGPVSGASITGDGNMLMQIDLPAPIQNDAVTVTIGPGVTGVNLGLPLDGNGDGINGDPHTFTLRHLCLADVDDNDETDVFDLLAYLDAWFEGCP